MKFNFRPAPSTRHDYRVTRTQARFPESLAQLEQHTTSPRPVQSEEASDTRVTLEATRLMGPGRLRLLELDSNPVVCEK